MQLSPTKVSKGSFVTFQTTNTFRNDQDIWMIIIANEPRQISRGEVSLELPASVFNESFKFNSHVCFLQIVEVVRSLRIDRPSTGPRGSVFGLPDMGLRSGFPLVVRRRCR